MKTVLIAEDEKMIRRGLAAMVSRAPVAVEEVLEARDGLQALEILQTRPVDLLITDIRMPGMSGIELAQEVQKLERPPVMLVVSGYDDFTYAVSMLRSGVQDYLLKPVEREKFYAAVERAEQSLLRRDAAQREDDDRYLLSLRYLMLCRNPAEEAYGRFLQQYRRRFFKEEYRCLFLRKKAAMPVEALWLHAEDNSSFVCLLPAASEVGDVGSAGISKLHRGLEELREAYEQAAEAWKRAFFTGAPTVWEDPAATQPPETVAGQLVTLIGATRWQEAVRLWRNEAQRVRRGQVSPDAFARLCGETVAQVRRSYAPLLPDSGSGQNCASLWAFDGPEDYFRALEEWLEPFCLQIQEELADYENKQKIRQAVAYIRENFCKPLNMAIVSNQVSMNYSLFSRLFKQYTGENFVGYLQNLRLEEAKRLLRETDWHVNEISARCGFTDDKHFLKVFKLSGGVSPSEWRRANRCCMKEE